MGQEIHKQMSHFRHHSPLPPSPSLASDDREEMDHDQFLRHTYLDPGSQGVPEDGIVPGARPASFSAQPVYENGARGRAFNQPATNRPPEYPLPWAASDFDISLEDEESRGVSHTTCGSISTLLQVADTP